MAFFVCSLFIILCLDTTASWSYHGSDGPAYWKDGYPACGKSQQSPIDIITEDNVCLASEPIRLVYWGKCARGMTLSNNGHSVVVKIDGDYFIEGGNLEGTYKVSQFHFHWGTGNSNGSEHTIGGHAHPLEMHFVSYKTTYSSLEEAMEKPDGLAVLAVFFDVDRPSDPIGGNNRRAAGLGHVLDYFSRIEHKGSKTNIPPFPLEELAPSSDQLDNFYRYSGSLTTPPCYQSVLWTVFKHVYSVSKEELAKFRGLYKNELGEVDEHLADNFRPTQPLNGRFVCDSKC